MSLRNQHWMSLQGEPITGRAPPRTFIMNGVQMSPQQAGEVAYHYKLLTYKMHASVIPYMVQERMLSDGTRVRLVSSYGTDMVYVWPVGVGGKDRRAEGWLFVIKAVRTKGTYSEESGATGEYGWHEGAAVTKAQLDGVEYSGRGPERKLINAAVTLKIESSAGKKRPVVINRGGTVGLGMRSEWRSSIHYGTGVTVVGDYVFVGPHLCAEVPQWPTWEEGLMLQFSRPDPISPGDLYVATTKGVMLWKIPTRGGKLRKFSDDDFIALKEAGGSLPQVEVDFALIIRFGDYADSGGANYTAEDAAFTAGGDAVAWTNSFGPGSAWAGFGKIRAADEGGYELREDVYESLTPGAGGHGTAADESPPYDHYAGGRHTGPFGVTWAGGGASSLGEARFAVLKGNELVFGPYRQDSSSATYQSARAVDGFGFSNTWIYPDLWDYPGNFRGPYESVGSLKIMHWSNDPASHKTAAAYECRVTDSGPGWVRFQVRYPYVYTDPLEAPAYEVRWPDWPTVKDPPEEIRVYRGRTYLKTVGDRSEYDSSETSSATFLGVAGSHSFVRRDRVVRQMESAPNGHSEQVVASDVTSKKVADSIIYANADTGWLVVERWDQWDDDSGSSWEREVRAAYAVDVVKVSKSGKKTYTVYEESFSGTSGNFRNSIGTALSTSLSRQVMGCVPGGWTSTGAASGASGGSTRALHCFVSSPDCIMFSLVPGVLRPEYRENPYDHAKVDIDVKALALAVCDDGTVTDLYEFVGIPPLPRKYTNPGENSSAFEMTLLREKL